MVSKYKFSMWLVDTLLRQPLTLPQIQCKWQDASVNEEGIPLSVRTFNRYRREAEYLLDVDIKCDKSNGNVYKLVSPESFKTGELQQWLYSAFRISNLARDLNNHHKIILEQAPPAAHLLPVILGAINQKKILTFTYKSHYRKPEKIKLLPVFIRLFKQRWYVAGEKTEEQSPMICAFERINDPEISEEKATLSRRMEKLIQSDTFFEHCYGIIRLQAPILIRFRAFWPQNAYITDVPIHSSQKIITQTENYTDFEVYLRPTYDLKQEFLWHRDKLAILSPESFRQDMIRILKATLQNYETGENHALDE